MNLYRVSRKGVPHHYDFFDSMVVAAEDEDSARRFHPGQLYVWVDELGWSYEFTNGYKSVRDYAWVDDIDELIVELIGTAIVAVEPGVVVASFNAG